MANQENINNFADNKRGVWEKSIPKANTSFLILNLVLVFGLDMLLAISNRSLLEFWHMMLWVFAGSAVFFVLENFIFRNTFSNTELKMDKWIYALVVLRNIIVLLNFIPFIQLLGLLIGFYAVWIYPPLYAILIIIRFVQTKKAV